MNAESGLESSVKSYMLRKVEVWHVLTYISVVDCKTSECTGIDMLIKCSLLSEYCQFFWMRWVNHCGLS